MCRTVPSSFSFSFPITYSNAGCQASPDQVRCPVQRCCRRVTMAGLLQDIVKTVTCQIAGKSKHACQPRAKRRDDSSRRFNESCGGYKRVDSDSAFARPPQIQLCITRMSLYKRIDPGRTRTCNLWFRNPTPYPLGHRADEISSTAHERSLQEIM